MGELVGGVEESAGGVDFDQDGLVMICGGGFECAFDVFGGDRVDSVVDDDFEDVG